MNLFVYYLSYHCFGLFFPLACWGLRVAFVFGYDWRTKIGSANVATEVRYISTSWRRARVISFVIYLFLNSTLPIPDTKGISSSLAILANCLEQMSLNEYIALAQMYGLTATHPLLQAYYCSYESALRSQYTPLFYARHKVSQELHKVLFLI